ncbi:hypothetical protein [Rossellomorea sp. KS-H15a]|uniref:hypothetical protein n=1 Tax=Rossellomorea sp. KS-H15a TaxID=2963940 RepID=UPI0020C66EE1|nr:hypothetical protein [Rossellomorea sp. KS-H15a]UTE77513.1 hypothetical protein M1J35_01460 [Rossellomorea sp. KS-H15a]
MGFFDAARSAYDKLVEQGEKKQVEMYKRKDRIESNKSRYQRYDDETLKRMYREANGDSKYSIGLVLKDRGY